MTARTMANGLRPLAAPLLLLAVVIAFLLVTCGYPADSRAMPVLVGLVMVVLLLLDLLSRTATPLGRAVLHRLNPAEAPQRAGSGQGASPRPILFIVLFGLGFALFGTAVAVPAYVLGAMRVHGRHGWLPSAVAAGATLLFVFVLFSLLLRLPLFPGLLFGGDF